jgi:hypothetical protein
LNVRRATRERVKSSRPTGTGGAVRAAILVLVLCRSLGATTSAAPPLPAEDVREQRWTKEEEPLWREALALPQTALLVAAWPLKQVLFWAECVNFPARLADFVLYPVRHLGSKEDKKEERE